MPTVDWPTIQHALISLAVLVLSICGPFLAREGILYLKAHRLELEASAAGKLHMPAETLDTVVTRLVKWAEQTLASEDGQKKKELVLEAVTTYFASRGIALPFGDIDKAIEAAVLDLPPSHPAAVEAPKP